MEEQVPADWDCPDDPPPGSEFPDETRGEPPLDTVQENTSEPELPQRAPKWMMQGHDVSEYAEDLIEENGGENKMHEDGLAPTQPKSASPVFSAVPDEGISKASAAARHGPGAVPLSKAACGPPPQMSQSRAEYPIAEIAGVAFTPEGASKAAAVARHDSNGSVNGNVIEASLAMFPPPLAEPPPQAFGAAVPPAVGPPLAGMPMPPSGYWPVPPQWGQFPHGAPPSVVSGQYPWPYPQGHPMSRFPAYPAPPGAYPAPVGPNGLGYPGQGARPPMQPYGVTPGHPPPGCLTPLGALPAGPPPGNLHSRPTAAWVGTRPSSPRKESHHAGTKHRSRKDKHEKYDKHDKYEKKHRRRHDASQSRSRSLQKRRRRSTRKPSPVVLQPAPPVKPTPPPRPQGHNVFFSNIPPDLTAIDLAEALTDVSEQRIEAVDLFRDAQGLATGEALVVFASYTDACNTVVRYHGGDLNGRTLNVVLRS